MARLHLCQEILNIIYPVGSIYMSTNSVNPSTLFGGTWTAITGRFLLGADSTYKAGSTGGESAHVLNITETPPHIHYIDGGAHNHRLPMKLDDKDSPQNLDYLYYDGYGWGSYYNHTKTDGDHVHNCSSIGGRPSS